MAIAVAIPIVLTSAIVKDRPKVSKERPKGSKERARQMASLDCHGDHGGIRPAEPVPMVYPGRKEV